ncbi:kinase-like domain-containing protein [Rhizophagus clarus]|uniref:Kinase-like domain-containing protein n=1 Tax=Rhizophagus clarus TaxID=94130 RepID=A0A8H3QJE6_9GLOM|nr:kinase-like domain-containing protein [Rhizophagus clarus]
MIYGSEIQYTRSESYNCEICKSKNSFKSFCEYCVRKALLKIFSRCPSRSVNNPKSVYDNFVYMAPEIICGSQRQHTPESDIYSFGMIWLEILSEKPPYYGPTLIFIFEKLKIDKVHKKIFDNSQSSKSSHDMSESQSRGLPEPRNATEVEQEALHNELISLNNRGIESNYHPEEQNQLEILDDVKESGKNKAIKFFKHLKKLTINKLLIFNNA